MNSKPQITTKYALKGSNLKKLLKSKGITKWRLAKDCDISYRTIQYWEKGKTMPSDENFKKVIEYLGLKTNRLNNNSFEQRFKQLENNVQKIMRTLGLK